MRNFLKYLGTFESSAALFNAKLLTESEIDLKNRRIRLIVEGDGITDEENTAFCNAVKNTLNVEYVTLEVREDRNAEFKNRMKQEEQNYVKEATAEAVASDGLKPGDIVYGKPFKGEPTPLIELGREYGRYVVEGDIFKVNEIVTKRGRLVYTISISDNTYSINLKLICDKQGGFNTENSNDEDCHIN